jgi:hypothetical protein
MRSITFILFLAIAACGGAADQPRATSASFGVTKASFASYQSFSFGLADQPRSGYETTPRSLEVGRRLQALVVEALRSRGYTDHAEAGDFIVKLAAGTGAAAPRFTRGTEAFGVHTDDSKPVARGFIGISIYDAATGVQVWQGTAFAEIDPEMIDDSLLKMGVAHMLASFPRRGNTAVVSGAF